MIERERFLTGEEVDLSAEDDRTIPASLLESLISGPESRAAGRAAHQGRDHRGAYFERVRVNGTLLFNDSTFSGVCSLLDAVVEDNVVAVNATFENEFTASCLRVAKASAPSSFRATSRSACAQGLSEDDDCAAAHRRDHRAGRCPLSDRLVLPALSATRI